MCLPRIKVNVNLDDRADEYFASSTSYSHKHSSSSTSSSTSSQIRHREHHRHRRSSYDYSSSATTNTQEKRLFQQRVEPKREPRNHHIAVRENPRQIRGWEPNNREQLPARVIYDPVPRIEPGYDMRRMGRYVKRVEHRIIAQDLVEVLEIVPRGIGGEKRREKGYNRHRDLRLEPAREFVVREPKRELKGWRRNGF